MPVAYTTNSKASEDYIITVYGNLSHATPDDDDPAYKATMDSVLQSILKRLPLGSMAEQYRIVCNVEARAGQEEEDSEDDEFVTLMGHYRVWIALHMSEGAGGANCLRTCMIDDLKGEIIDESINAQDTHRLELEFGLIRDYMNPYHHPSMQQLVRYFKQSHISDEICRRIFCFLEMKGVQCISVNGVSERFMVDTWSEITSKCPQYMNNGYGYMVHPMWMYFRFSANECEWRTIREQSYMFYGDHWRVYNLQRATGPISY